MVETLLQFEHYSTPLVALQAFLCIQQSLCRLKSLRQKQCQRSSALGSRSPLRNLAEKYTKQIEVGRHCAPTQRNILFALMLQSTRVATFLPRLRVAHPTVLGSTSFSRHKEDYLISLHARGWKKKALCGITRSVNCVCAR